MAEETVKNKNKNKNMGTGKRSVGPAGHTHESSCAIPVLTNMTKLWHLGEGVKEVTHAGTEIPLEGTA